MSRAVEAVVFDWGGTLTPWHTVDLAEQWRVYAREHAAHTHEAENLAAKLLDIEAAAWARQRSGAGSARMTEILAAAGVDAGHEGHQAARLAYEEFWEPHTLIDPDVPALWQGLRDRGVKVGVLSNTIWTRDYHERVFERDGVLHLLDGAVYSSEIAHAKPHPDAFAAALAAVGVGDPARAVYVGDRPFEDVHGAQQAGMRAVLVPHSEIPLDQQMGVETTPDAVVHRLLDLLDVVDAWLA